MKKALSSMLAALMLSTVLFGCNGAQDGAAAQDTKQDAGTSAEGTAPAADKKVKIGITLATQNEFNTVLQNGCEDRAKQNGYTIDVQIANEDMSTQISQIRTFASSGCDAIVIQAVLNDSVGELLDAAGYPDMQVMASNSLDEYLVRDLLVQGARIDSFGIGERLITSKSEPVFGGVYKLAAVENERGDILPKIKVSENVEKITTPHFKKVWRLFDNETGKALGDVLCVHDEAIDESKPYTLFHPIHTWKKKVVTNYSAKPLLVQLFDKGRKVYESPDIEQIRDYCAQQMETLWQQVTRFENPQTYYVDLSQELWDVKHKLLEDCRIV